jgi:hypothetical protein
LVLAVEVMLSQLENAAYACHLSVQLSSTSDQKQDISSRKSF